MCASLRKGVGRPEGGRLFAHPFATIFQPQFTHFFTPFLFLGTLSLSHWESENQCCYSCWRMAERKVTVFHLRGGRGRGLADVEGQLDFAPLLRPITCTVKNEWVFESFTLTTLMALLEADL